LDLELSTIFTTWRGCLENRRIDPLKKDQIFTICTPAPVKIEKDRKGFYF
jgi:hypothetical protein